MADVARRETDIIGQAKACADDYVRPRAADWERARRLPAEAFVEAAKAGLTSAILPEEVGGAGISMLAASRLAETLARPKAEDRRSSLLKRGVRASSSGAQD